MFFLFDGNKTKNTLQKKARKRTISKIVKEMTS